MLERGCVDRVVRHLLVLLPPLRQAEAPESCPVASTALVGICVHKRAGRAIGSVRAAAERGPTGAREPDPFLADPMLSCALASSDA